MTVALGFDTFLVMRHGIPPLPQDAPEKPVPVVAGKPYEGQLGCYYCNDIVAPRDVRSLLSRQETEMLILETRSHSRIGPWTKCAPSLAPESRPSRPPRRSSLWSQSCSTHSGSPSPSTASSTPLIPAQQVPRALGRAHHLVLGLLADDSASGRQRRLAARSSPAPDPRLPRSVPQHEDHGPGVGSVHGVLEDCSSLPCCERTGADWRRRSSRRTRKKGMGCWSRRLRTQSTSRRSRA